MMNPYLPADAQNIDDAPLDFEEEIDRSNDEPWQDFEAEAEEISVT